MNLLIADDNEINRQFLRAVLGDSSHRISEASNGHEAIEHCQQQQFDLVFMDIRMPEMDGIEATRLIRKLADHDPDRTCIIALTADLQLTLKNQLMAEGFNACLTKPISKGQLLDTVKQVRDGLCLETREQQDEPSGIQPIDLEKAMAATGGNRELLSKLTQMFVDELLQMIPVINSGIASGDFGPVRDCAHKLRASAGYCGAIPVQQAATAIETAAISADLDDAKLAADALQRASDQLLAHLASEV